MSERFYRAAITSLSLIAHGAAFLQLRSILYSLPEDWRIELLGLLSMSFALSLSASWLKNRAGLWTALILKALILMVLGMPLGGNLTVESALAAALILEALAYPPLWEGGLFLLAVMAALFTLQQPLLISGRLQEAPAPLDLASLGLSSAFAAALGLVVRRYREILDEARQTQDRLDEATIRLARTNIELQEYAALSEQKAAVNERRRLARDLHDSLGYTLTNLIMMLEAAVYLQGDANPGLREHLETARDKAQEGLAEMRKTMRIIRQRETDGVIGIKAVYRLVKSFDRATRLEVKLHLGDAPWSLGVEKDQIVYRFVQEGISNALRHGGATKIGISFCQRDGGVLVSIHDNGVGFAQMIEGCGILGMRERIEQVGGHTAISSKPRAGTLLSAWIPLESV